MMLMMQSTMARLYSKPPSSRSMVNRKFMSTACFRGYFWHRALMAWTTTTLNSSEISDMKEEICFIRRSMLLSLPVLRSVVMAKVAMLRFESVTRFSRSRLQAVTADGCFMATLLRVRTAA